MATAGRISQLSPYAERLLDDYIYDQLDDAATKLEAAYRRISRRPAKDSLDDKRVRRCITGAAASIRNAALAASGRKPDRGARRRAPRAFLLFGAIGGLALVIARRRKQKQTFDYAPVSSEPDAQTDGVGGERVTA